MEKNRIRDYQAIGEFIFQFSQLEHSIKHTISNLLKLSDVQFNIVTGPYDFSSLCNVAYSLLVERYPENGTEYKRWANECRALNDQRVKVAHGLWTADAGGLLATHVSRQKLIATPLFKLSGELPRLVGQAKKLMTDVLTFGEEAATEVLEAEIYIVDEAKQTTE